MVAAILPQSDQAWFFKIMGRKSAVDAVADDFKRFVQNMEFTDGTPVIGELPANWKRGANRPMRFASIDINTPAQQLDLSISQLARSDQWDALVTSNVVRWRKQVGLDGTDEKWSSAEELQWAGSEASDDAAIWVDVMGRPEETAGSPMMADAPFAQMGAGTMGAGTMGAGAKSDDETPTDPHAGLPRATREQIAARTKAAKEKNKSDNVEPMPSVKEDTTSLPKADVSVDPVSEDPASKLKYDRPEGWRDGRMSMMRLAAFDVGPDDATAEVTIINAGGDLRGNVARWMGQIRKSAVPDEEVDAVLENAEKFEIAGRSAQRFVLMPEDIDAEDASAIDATIIPIENSFSMFVKMTGPPATIKDQSEQMKSFLQSIKF